MRTAALRVDAAERVAGSLTYAPAERMWRIQCEPHVRLRLKRVFGKVSLGSHDVIEISDTLETSRDLEWFVARYPLQASRADLARLQQRADQHREQAETVARIVSDGYVASSFALALPPRDYQRVAAELILRTGGVLVADDLGVGKTVTAICTFAEARTLPALVVTLTHLPTQWQEELAKFAPHLRTHVLRSGQPYDIVAAMRGRRRRHDTTSTLPGFNEWPDVIITNYHKLSGWADTLAGQVKSVVFDEVQELRHTGSYKYAAAKHVASGAQFRTGLSATPFYNYGGEMFSVLDVLRPGALGERDEFIREWCTDLGHDRLSVKDPKAFGTYLRSEGLMLRRTRRDVGRELPPLTKIIQHVDADPEALDRVQGSAAELAKLILAGPGGGLARGAKFRAAEELSLVLRQATGIAKAPFVADFVRLLVESGEKVLLYGWHRSVYDIWLERLKDLSPVLFTGTESPKQKEEAKKSFLDPEGAKILVMSLRAGAGLDGLQRACRNVVFGELDFSPGVHEQCCGRPHRDGQTDPVMAYFLVADSGSDPVVADVLGLKRAQIEGVRDPAADLITRLDTGTGHIAKLAEDFLRQRGIAVPMVG